MTLNHLTNATTYTDTPQGYTTQVGSGNYAEAYGCHLAGNLDVRAGVDLNASRNDASQVHAVTHIGSTQKYWYDQNGNQTTRIVGADMFNLIYLIERGLRPRLARPNEGLCRRT